MKLGLSVSQEVSLAAVQAAGWISASHRHCCSWLDLAFAIVCLRWQCRISSKAIRQMQGQRSSASLWRFAADGV
jgi:hypothetical protein